MFDHQQFITLLLYAVTSYVFGILLCYVGIKLGGGLIMISIILVMIGGGLGAIARSAITDYFNHKFTSKLPIATLIVNLVGSFLIGLTIGLSISTSWFLRSLLPVFR